MNNQIHSPVAAERYIHDNLHDLDHEECWCIFLSPSREVITADMLTKGTLKSTAIDARTVLRQALLINASSVILVHNHLSGNPLPSNADIVLTAQLKKACTILDVTFDDHIIVASKSFYSFAEEQTYQIQ